MLRVNFYGHSYSPTNYRINYLLCRNPEKKQDSKIYKILEHTYENILTEKKQIKQLRDHLFSVHNIITQSQAQLSTEERVPALAIGEK